MGDQCPLHPARPSPARARLHCTDRLVMSTPAQPSPAQMGCRYPAHIRDAAFIEHDYTFLHTQLVQSFSTENGGMYCISCNIISMNVSHSNESKNALTTYYTGPALHRVLVCPVAVLWPNRRPPPVVCWTNRSSSSRKRAISLT